MKITPLQWLLLSEIEPIERVRQVTGCSRATFWRWSRGKSHPDRPTAELLIGLYNGQLDFNGCYDATREISDDEARAFGLRVDP